MSVRIVIVDDHPIMRAGLRLTIAGLPDCSVVGEAGTGEEAIQVVRDVVPDLVVLDVSLPDQEGSDTARQILAERPQTKVLMLSAFTDPDFVNRSIAAGASGYVVKTSAAGELARAITTVMDGNVFLSPEVASTLVSAYRDMLTAPVSPQTSPLSEREREVLTLIAEGLKARDIAVRLGIGVKTVDTYRARLLAKLHCGSTAELVRYAIREGLISV
jgi:DNA-binding NarL/FixJ family response regulator